ncbi:sigma-70 family RNA polymerase sigma factor [bacterium]|nr:sigma-70 family RNA polymerase sigma factor [bacterium]
MAEASDEVLMASHLAGDREAYGLLVHRYEKELFSYLQRMLGDAMLAEDVFQNTFLTVHTKRHLFVAGRPFRPWLYTLATHQAIDAMRRNGRHNRPSLNQRVDQGTGDQHTTMIDLLSSTQASPNDEVERAETAQLVRTSVEELPEHLRSAIVLCYYQGFKYKEIAQVLGIPVGTVKSRLHAAVVRLTESWRKLGLLTGDPA